MAETNVEVSTSSFPILGSFYCDTSATINALSDLIRVWDDKTQYTYVDNEIIGWTLGNMYISVLFSSASHDLSKSPYWNISSLKYTAKLPDICLFRKYALPSNKK